MDRMKDQRRIFAMSIGTVVANLVLLGVHAFSHASLNISLTDFESAFVLVVLIIAPITSSILISTRFREIGAWLLLTSMLASFVFGLTTHFLIQGPDNAINIQPNSYGILFQTTAAALGVAEAAGVAAGAFVLSSKRSLKKAAA